jgi:carbonic anhydrase
MTFKLMLVAATLSAAAWSVHAADTAEHAASASAMGHTGATGHAAHWEYAGHGGPSHWSELEDGFATCKLGKTQSPIDIRGAKKGKLEPIGFNYATGPAEVINNGHTVQVNLSNGGSVKLADGEYKLLQFHFHTPAEEQVNGVKYPLVAHFVHKNAEGKLAVVAVLFKEGAENAQLKSVFANMPAKAGESKALDGGLDPASVLPEQRGYYAYRGSLTTPPCSEGVRWQVLKQTVTLSKEQLAAFKTLYPMNARPVQPLNGRKIEVSQ